MASRSKTRLFPIRLLILIILTLPTFSLGAQARAAEAPSFALDGVKAAILFDAGTGETLYEYQADEPRPPASMAKMMTYYVVLDAIKQGWIGWDDMVTASKYAADVIGSQAHIREGESYSVRDLAKALMLASANDAAVMLAEHVGGSEENFAYMMNAKAKELGLSESAYFINATGLQRYDLGANAPLTLAGETMLTARDTALLALHLIQDYPEVLETTRMTNWKLRDTDEKPLTNSNWMLEDYLSGSAIGGAAGGEAANLSHLEFAYRGMDGLKTGYIQAAGHCFTGTAVRDGIRLVSVVMGTDSMRLRFEKTKELLDYGFSQFGVVKLAEAGAGVTEMRDFPVRLGKKGEVRIAAASDAAFIGNLYASEPSYHLEVQATADAPLMAPVAKGDRIGVATFSYRGQTQTIDLVAAEDVPALTWLERSLRGVLGRLLSWTHSLGFV